MTNNKIDPSNWVKNFGDYLYTIAYYKLSNAELAEDIVQDTFLSALKAKDSFQSKSSEKTWLTSILNNKIVDYYRSKKPKENLDSYIATTDESFKSSFFEYSDNGAYHWKDKIISYDWNQDEQLLDNEKFYSVFIDCIDKLPSKLSNIIRFKFIDNAPAEEICTNLDISISNYFVIIHRSKILLKSCLDNNWFNDEKN